MSTRKKTPPAGQKAKIMALLQEVQTETGSMPLLILGAADGSFTFFGNTSDLEGFISDVYDSVFPSLVDEVQCIDKMGTRTLKLNYTKKDLNSLLSECGDMPDGEVKQHLQNILLDALMRYAEPVQRRKKK